jgi:hypothetical protein
MLAALGFGAGCAAPAPPRPPRRQIPQPVTDLRVHQVGETVVLHFTLPHAATDGRSLAGPRRVQIYREFVSAAVTGQASAPSRRAAFTLDARQLASHMVGETVTVRDSFSPVEFQAHQGRRIAYRLRTAAGQGPWSALSHPSSLTLVVPPDPPSHLTATVSNSAMVLRWSPPAPGSAPTPISFTLYRTPLHRDGQAAGSTEAIGVTTGTAFQDTSIEPGRSYRYTLRSLVPAPTGTVESADSAPLIVRVPPLAPPSPQGVVAIPVRRPSGSLEVDLSWAIGGERDLAGYNVYRSERRDERGVRLNRHLLASATFRDTTVAAGRVYYYSVTAVDRAGNESVPSAPATVTLPAPGAGHD